jgi:hypothetical protein
VWGKSVVVAELRSSSRVFSKGIFSPRKGKVTYMYSRMREVEVLSVAGCKYVWEKQKEEAQGESEVA